MICLTNRSSTTTQTLVMVLAGAAATTYPTFSVFSYIVPPQSKPDFSEYRLAPEFTLPTAQTETTIAAAPPEGSVKNIKSITVYNTDTASITVTIAIDSGTADSSANRVQWKGTLLTLESVYYEDGQGWYAVDANGNRKETVSTVNSSSVLGTTTNDNAAAGRVGEIISSEVLGGSAVSLSTGTQANITSISLTAGDWDISAQAIFDLGATTSYTELSASVSQTSATLSIGPIAQPRTTIRVGAVVPGSVSLFLPMATGRVSLAATTTVYLVVRSTFTISTMTSYGYILARRAR